MSKVEAAAAAEEEAFGVRDGQKCQTDQMLEDVKVDQNEVKATKMKKKIPLINGGSSARSGKKVGGGENVLPMQNRSCPQQQQEQPIIAEQSARTTPSVD